MTTTNPEPCKPDKDENSKAWADAKITELVKFSMGQGNKLLTGNDVRDKLTSLQQRQALIIIQAQKLHKRMIKKTKPELPHMGKNEQLFDMFAEKIARKLSEIEQEAEKKKQDLDKNRVPRNLPTRPDLFDPKAST